MFVCLAIHLSNKSWLSNKMIHFDYNCLQWQRKHEHEAERPKLTRNETLSRQPLLGFWCLSIRVMTGSSAKRKMELHSSTVFSYFLPWNHNNNNHNIHHELEIILLLSDIFDFSMTYFLGLMFWRNSYLKFVFFNFSKCLKSLRIYQ